MKKKSLGLISIVMVITLILSLVPANTVKAAGEGDVNYGTVVDALGESGAGGSSKVKNGITYARTGYLCYLVGATGELIPGMQAYAFKCDGFNGLPNSKWYCNSKKGNYSATTWKGTAPWGVGPFNEDKTTNVGQIRQYFLEKTNGVQNGVEFVKDNWGEKIVEGFKSGEYVLVLETILNFQPNIKTEGGHVSGATLDRKKIIEKLKEKGYDQSKYPSDVWESIIKNVRDRWELKFGNSAGGVYQTVGQPVIGTCSDCITYENVVGGQSSIFASYTNRICCFAEYIAIGDIGERAGFTAWSGSTSSQISDSDVKAFGVAMLVVSCKDKGQSTCDEPLAGTPHPAPEESKGNKVIIKSYRTKNLTTGEILDDGCFIKKDVANRIIVEDEIEYRLVEWKVSTTEASVNSITWPVPGSISQSGKSLGLVELKEPTEKVLYVLLEKVEEEEPELLEGIDYYINESQISKRVTLSEAIENTDANTIKEREFIWILPALQEECSGHDYISEYNAEVKDDEGNVIGHEDKHDTAYCSGFEITDHEITVALKNELFDQYKEVLSDTQYEEPLPEDSEMLEYDREQNYEEQEHITNTWDERLVIHRGKDKLTIAEWKGIGLEAADITSEADMYAVGNTPQGIRKTMDFTDTFDVKIVDNSPDLTTVSEPSIDSGHGICPPDEQDATIEEFLISPLNVYIYTYSGSPDGGTNNTECREDKMISFSSGSTHRSGVMLPTGTTFSFYPYIEMRYDTLDSDDLQVYVLGQYRRSMTPNDYAEVIWKQQSDANLTLSSKQWSTHAMANTGEDWRQKDSVLPGGAVMNLGIRKEDRQKVTVRTYQTILEEDGRTQAEFAGAITGMTEADAVAYHQQYVASIVSALDNLCVEQYANTSWSGDPFDGQIVTPGCTLGSGFDAENHKASTEDKYYFRDIGGAAAQEGDLDVREVSNNAEKYTFSSDTSGNILMNGGELFGQASDESALGGVAKEINDRTLVVTKLVDAIERNTGSDGEAQNISPCWYNEAFDGVTVIVQTTVLETGMVDPSERAAVLDVKLTPKNKGQKDLFSKAYSSQFKMKDTISTYNDKWQVGMFSNLGGSKNVYMEKMEDLYHSKKFYIPNVNTQDLK